MQAKRASVPEVPRRALSGAGSRASRQELSCRRCGYGIVARGAPPARCPMCGASTWKPSSRGGLAAPVT